MTVPRNISYSSHKVLGNYDLQSKNSNRNMQTNHYFLMSKHLIKNNLKV